MIWLISAITVLYVISISARGHGAAGDLPTAYPGPVKQPSLPIAEGASDTPSPPITALPTGHPVTSSPTITPQSAPIARTPYTNTTAAPGFKPAPSGPASGDIVHFSGGNPSGPKPAPGVAPVTWLGAPNSSSRPPGSRLPVDPRASVKPPSPNALNSATAAAQKAGDVQAQAKLQAREDAISRMPITTSTKIIGNNMSLISVMQGPRVISVRTEYTYGSNNAAPGTQFAPPAVKIP